LYKNNGKAMCSILKAEVQGFLLSVKLTIQKDSRSEPTWTFSTVRDNNIQTLADLEMKTAEVKDIVLSLTPLDYVRGPIKDRKMVGDLWEFGKEVKGQEVYIKLKLTGDLKSQNVRVLSFHFPERPINYMLRDKSTEEKYGHGDKLPSLRKSQRNKFNQSGTGNFHSK